MYNIRFILKTQSINDTLNLKAEIMNDFLTKKYVKHIIGNSDFYNTAKTCSIRMEIKPFTKKRLIKDLNRIKYTNYYIIKERKI